MLDQCLNILLEHTINLEKHGIVAKHKECNFFSIYPSNLNENLLAFLTTANISLGRVSHKVFYEMFEFL